MLNETKPQTIDSKNDNKKFVHLISGARCWVKKTNIAGFCNYSLHRGYLTVALYKKQKCAEKECKCFRKCKEALYWDIVEQEKKHKRERRLRAKNLKAIQKDNELALEGVKNKAQSIAQERNYPVLFVGVRHKDDTIYLNYVSESCTNDWFSYKDIAFELREHYKYKINLVHIRAPDRHYVTIQEYYKIKSKNKI